jgi:hypothetical protein
VYNKRGMKSNTRTISTPRGAGGWFAEIHKQLDNDGAKPGKYRVRSAPKGPSTISERAKVDEVIAAEVAKGEWNY